MKESPKLGDLLKRVDDDIARIPMEYVPPADRTAQLGQLTADAVSTFAELPTSELDSMVDAVENKLAQIRDKADSIKRDYMMRTAELREAVERLNSACLHGETKMDELRTKFSEIYALDQQSQQRR